MIRCHADADMLERAAMCHGPCLRAALCLFFMPPHAIDAATPAYIDADTLLPYLPLMLLLFFAMFTFCHMPLRHTMPLMFVLLRDVYAIAAALIARHYICAIHAPQRHAAAARYADALTPPCYY